MTTTATRVFSAEEYSGKSSNSPHRRAAAALLLCAAGFALGRSLFFPGFLDFSMPSHSDLYRYFIISQSDLPSSVWRTPRPLSVCWLWFVGRLFGSPELVWASLAALSVSFLGALVFVFERIFALRFSSLAIVLYAATVSALPASWQIYQLDFGGMLSGLLCVGAVLAFRRAKTKRINLLYSALLLWAAVEAKPTFGILMPLACVCYAAQQRSRESIAALLAVIGISMLVVLKDKFLGSPFVSFEAGNVYQVRIDPMANAIAVFQYMKAAVPLSLVPGLIFVYACALTNPPTRSLAAWMPAAALAAIAPMGLIPNRVMHEYSWYISIFLFAPLLTLGGAVQGRHSAYHKIGAFTAVILVCLGLWNVCLFSPATCAWVRSIASYNANVVGSLRILGLVAPEIADGKVLVSGLRGPYHAFWNDTFIRKISGLQDYIKILRRSELPWNVMATEDGEAEYLNKVDLRTFDYFAVYGDDGKLRYLISRSQLEQIPPWWQAAVVFGVGSIDSAQLKSSDLVRALDALQTEGETSATEAIRSRIDYEDSPEILAPPTASIVTVGEWGPKATEAGNPFNTQPDGRSAMWTSTKGIAPHADNYVEFGGVKITEIAYHPDHISFAVPSSAFATPGERKVSFFDAESGQSLEIGVFKVLPAQ